MFVGSRDLRGCSQSVEELPRDTILQADSPISIAFPGLEFACCWEFGCGRFGRD